MAENALDEDRPDGRTKKTVHRSNLFDCCIRVVAEDRHPSGEEKVIYRNNLIENFITITAENLRRCRMSLPLKPRPLFSSVPTYVGIERAVVLGSEQSFEGKVFIAEPDGRLKPVDGKDLVALHRDFPNFVRQWKIPELD